MKAIIEYQGYMQSELIAIGEDCNNYDLVVEVPFYDSSGYLEPIIQCGFTKRYDLVELDVPQWLIDGVKRGMQDGRWYSFKSAELCAAKIITNDIRLGRTWASCLKRLAKQNRKFANSLKAFFAEKGYLTDKQAMYV